jgi:hypothetical protein
MGVMERSIGWRKEEKAGGNGLVRSECSTSAGKLRRTQATRCEGSNWISTNTYITLICIQV